MPVPIRPLIDQRGEQGQQGSLLSNIDFSTLLDFDLSPKKSKEVYASNKDAAILFQLWAESEKPQNGIVKVQYSNNITKSDVIRLKTQGFITGGVEEVAFTKKGRKVITTMALGETNKFEGQRQEKPYSEILASMNKRNKPGYRIPKFATNNSNNIRLS